MVYLQREENVHFLLRLPCWNQLHGRKVLLSFWSDGRKELRVYGLATAMSLLYNYARIFVGGNPGGVN